MYRRLQGQKSLQALTRRSLSPRPAYCYRARQGNGGRAHAVAWLGGRPKLYHRLPRPQRPGLGSGQSASAENVRNPQKCRITQQREVKRAPRGAPFIVFCRCDQSTIQAARRGVGSSVPNEAVQHKKLTAASSCFASLFLSAIPEDFFVLFSIAALRSCSAEYKLGSNHTS